MTQRRIKFSFSQAHADKKSKRNKRRTRRSQTTKLTPSLPTAHITPLSTELSQEERMDLRTRQLMARRLPDPDLTVQDPRGEQHNQFDGPNVNTIFPVVNGPQPRNKMRILEDEREDNDPIYDRDLSINDPDLRIAAVEPIQKIKPIAGGHFEEVLLEFDNAMTRIFTPLNHLKDVVQSLDTFSRETTPETQNQVHRMKEILNKAIEPWFMELEDGLNKIIAEMSRGENNASKT